MPSEWEKMVAGERYDSAHCTVHIGDDSLIGPGVQILTAMHPLDAALRRREEYGRPVIIGGEVWLGAGVVF